MHNKENAVDQYLALLLEAVSIDRADVAMAWQNVSNLGGYTVLGIPKLSRWVAW